MADTCANNETGHKATPPSRDADDIGLPRLALSPTEPPAASSSPPSTAASAACGSCEYRKGKPLRPLPFRIHMLHPTADGSEPSCDCGKQHMVKGRTYKYCTCGHSKAQPFCDDSHLELAPDFKPMPFVADKPQSFYLLCGCKQTDVPPHCDGSHIHIKF